MRSVEALGDKRVLLQSNHGPMICAESMEVAFDYLVSITLECCMHAGIWEAFQPASAIATATLKGVAGTFQQLLELESAGSKCVHEPALSACSHALTPGHAECSRR